MYSVSCSKGLLDPVTQHPSVTDTRHVAQAARMKKFMMHILHRSLHRPGNTTDGNHAQKHKVGVNAVYYIIADRRQIFCDQEERAVPIA